MLPDGPVVWGVAVPPAGGSGLACVFAHPDSHSYRDRCSPFPHCPYQRSGVLFLINGFQSR